VDYGRREEHSHYVVSLGVYFAPQFILFRFFATRCIRCSYVEFVTVMVVFLGWIALCLYFQFIREDLFCAGCRLICFLFSVIFCVPIFEERFIIASDKILFKEPEVVNVVGFRCGAELLVEEAFKFTGELDAHDAFESAFRSCQRHPEVYHFLVVLHISDIFHSPFNIKHRLPLNFCFFFIIRFR